MMPIKSEKLKKAAELLHSGGYTCVFLKDGEADASFERGVKPLFERLDSGAKLAGAVAADKVVGKGAAYLYVLLGIKELYADVISLPASQVLERYGIYFECENTVEAIRNRANTGFCPIESATLDIDEPSDAYKKIKSILK